jgi:hypothetical protein
METFLIKDLRTRFLLPLTKNSMKQLDERRKKRERKSG